MSSFTENTSISPIPKKGTWITTSTFRYYVYEVGIWPCVDIPEGFEFDWASIPRILWIFSPPAEPKTINSACLHDYLTDTRQFWYFMTHKIFYDSLLINWNSYFKSIIFFIWVCILWWISYYKIKDLIFNK